MFWILTGALTLLVALILVLALRRGAQAVPAEAYDLKVYRDQLAEVDKDVARGILNEEDAERARTEISRRILATDAALQKAERGAGQTGTATLYAVGVVMALVLAGGSFYTYGRIGAPGYGDLALADRIGLAQELREQRPDQEAAEASITEADLPPVEAPSPDYIALVERLRSVVSERPNDAQGLRLLAASERNLGNFKEARVAFSRYLDLRGPEATAAEFADMADMMVMAAGGYVSPEAERALALALERDPGNGPARYYWGLMMSQTGRPDQAFQIWDQLLREGPPEAPWIPPIQVQIEEIAMRAGVSYVMPEPGNALRGPSAADVANAQDMSPAERMEMIGGMVESLGARLASEGGPAGEWAQLITALGVLERRQDAMNVYQNALQVFAGNDTALDTLNRAAERAGIR